MARPKRIRPPKAHERQWGEGSVKEVRPGVWRAFRARSRDAEGNISRPSKTFTGATAQADAAQWAAGTVLPDVVLLGHWLDSWLALRGPTLSINTQKLYRAAVKGCGPLLRRPLAEITVDEWQAQTNALLQQWSRYHVYVWRGNITTALRAAMPEHLAANPLERVKLPKPQEVPPRAWRQDEVDRLLSAVEGTLHEAWVHFSLGTGVRLGEARAMLWTDIDWTTREATIRRSMDNSTNRIGPTKTGKVRVIDIPDEVMPVLSAHQKRQPAGQLLAFGHARGAYRPSTLREWLARRCAEAKVTPLPPHSFRHTFASLAIDAGVPITDIAKQLGHTVQTCQTTYAHWIGDGMRRAAKAIGAALRHRFSGPIRAIGSQNGTREGG